MHINLYIKKHWMFLFMALAFFLLWSSFVPVRFGRAQSPFLVGLVIQTLDSVEAKCVELDKPNPSGYDVLVAAGVPLIVDSNAMGTTICSIYNVGCPATDCFCQSYAPPYYYWSYWHLKNGNWVYSNQGASNYVVKHGDVEAWLWGDARTPPQLFSFAEICSSRLSPTASPTSTLTPSITMSTVSSQIPSQTTTKTPTNAPDYYGGATATPRATKSYKPIPTASSLFVPPSTILATTTMTPASTNNPFSSSAETATPSPTITLAYSFLVKNTLLPTIAQAESGTQINQTPEFDINVFSLTATAVALQRQPTLNAWETHESIAGTSTALLTPGLLSFTGFTGGLIILLVIFQRSRRG